MCGSDNLWVVPKSANREVLCAPKGSTMKTSTNKMLAACVLSFLATGACAQTASYDPSTRYLTIPSVQMGDGVFGNVVVRVDNFELISVGSAVVGTPVVSAKNATLDCNFSNRYMNQVNLNFTLENQSASALASIAFKATYAASGLPLPAVYTNTYSPVGGVISGVSSKRIVFVPNAYSDFSEAVFPYCGNTANKLTVQITAAYDANGKNILAK